MTNGVAVVLGKTGRNFGAGMSGGVAFVLELDERYVNKEMVRVGEVAGSIDERLLNAILARHHKLTGSKLAAELREDWPTHIGRFKKVHPHPSMEEDTAKDPDAESLEAMHLRQLEEADRTCGEPTPFLVDDPAEAQLAAV
jgi:glutamate synthase domain-containing protein 3